MKSKFKLSIIIPAFQEAIRIEKTLEELAAYMHKHEYADTEVVVVTADSPDGTASLARSKAKLFEHFRVVDAGPKAGKGRDVRTGMMEAHGAHRLFMDADLATPLHHLETIRQLAEEGVDVAIAVRDLNSSHRGLRRLISGAGNLLVRVLLLPGIRDSQCGFKMFSAKAADELFRRQTILGWGFDMEILAIARKLGYKIVTFPVPDWDDKPHGTFEDEVRTAALSTLGELLIISWRRLTGRYNRKTFSYEAYK
ncbi:MAG TPA: glycosyltransferase [Candidatus Saccharimonadales bacterium]|nr:glycosyltransferase [Candidatus Saccharimonadales bacterium]